MATKAEVMKQLEEVIDPEIGMNIVDLGLVYEVNINGKKVHAKITFTSPACPVGPMILEGIEDTLRKMGFETVDVEITFDPPWTQDKMSEKAKAALQFM